MKRVALCAVVIAATFFAAGTSPSLAQEAPSPALQELAAAAVKEGRLLIYDALPAETMEPVFAAFRAKYPEIAIDYVNAGGATGIIARVAQESRAGAQTADVVPLATESVGGLEETIGIRTVLQAVDWPSLGVPAGLVAAYPNPEDQIAVKYNSGLWSIIYNKDEVSSDLKWNDLLDPKWKGKVGLSQTLSIWVNLSRKWGEQQVVDYMTKLINEQEARIFGRTSEIVPAVSSGELAVAVVQRHSALPSIDSGAPVAVSATDDVVVNSGTLIGVPVHAAHPNAAKLFIAWLVSSEGQTVYDKATRRGLLSVEGTWGYENRDELNVVEWPADQFKEYAEISKRLSALFPK